MLNNKIYNLFIIFGMVLSLLACSPKIRLIYNASEIQNPVKDTLQIKNVRSDFWSDSLVVRLKNRKKLIFSPTSVWGVNYNNKVTYRFFNGQFYRVRQLDSVSIYSQHHSGYKSSHTCYYFSKSPNSEIYLLKWKNLKKQFATDTCFINNVDRGIKWYQDYSSFDKTRGSYRIVEYYKKCKNYDLNSSK